jgi:DNA repair protein RadC
MKLATTKTDIGYQVIGFEHITLVKIADENWAWRDETTDEAARDGYRLKRDALADIQVYIEANGAAFASPSGIAYTESELAEALVVIRKMRAAYNEVVTSSIMARELFYDIANEPRECFKVVALNRANKPFAETIMFTGGRSATIIDPKMVFEWLLLQRADAFIAGHNHPSGSLKPSQADIRITEKLKKAGQALDLPILDHVIVAPGGGTYSFADEGMLK